MYNGGYMRRLFRMSTLAVLLCIMGFGSTYAQDKPLALVGGRIAPGEVRVFSKDSLYKVFKQYTIDGTLIVEPGTTVMFSPNGRIIVSTGGRLIADGFASAQYTAKPDGQDPMPLLNNKGWKGYADLKYFLYNGTIVPGTPQEMTINNAKKDYIYNVVLDTATRKLINTVGLNGKNFNLGPTQFSIPFEKAIMYYLSGIAEVTDPLNDIRNNSAWKRPNTSENIKLEPSKIKFIGQVTNNFTREKGHIIVLPGAGAAFFRNCAFENMRKDTTVDYVNYYADDAMPNAAKVNADMIKMTNGAGGAITTFSSRTWLVSCEFNHNFARNAAGALQVLQAPEGFPLSDAKYNALDVYPGSKNPNITEINGDPSKVNSKIKRIDNLDEEQINEPNFTDYERQAYDDGRLAMFLGRMRNVKFNNNNVKLTNVKIAYFGSTPVEIDDEESVANFPQIYGNFAKGGAVLIAGRKDKPEVNQMEVGLGVNRAVNILTKNLVDTLITLADNDTVNFVGNNAQNLQNFVNSEGSMGGAIYLGANTSLIVAGKFNSNFTKSQFMEEDNLAVRAGDFSRGGAIYQENTNGRLQVRGYYTNEYKKMSTDFLNNTSASGGAIYVHGNYDHTMSPIIGGSDSFIKTRHYGYDINFKGNKASAEGGAIYTKRSMRINGAGGLVENSAPLYDDFRRIEFSNNQAGFSGGAISVVLPFKEHSQLKDEDRMVHFVRALFENNKVGETVSSFNRKFIRGGGAVYSETADMNVVKGVEFTGNIAKNGNGAAIQMAHPLSFKKRFFVSDLDVITYDANGVPTDFTSVNGPFILAERAAPADARMLTRFLDNKAVYDEDMLASQSGSGATQITYGTLKTGVNINAIEFINEQNGFAVGGAGTIIKLSNAGQVWEYKNYSVPYNLEAVHFTTERVGYIAGDRGLIMKTVNGGDSWTIVNEANKSFDIKALTFINSEVGYAVGQMGKMLKTSDAGATWAEMPSGTGNHLNDVRFVGVNNGYAVGDRGTILITNNGGLNWNVLNANTYNDFRSIYFTDATTGYIAGNGVIYKTTNSGNTWVNVYNDNTKYFNTVWFTSLDKGYAYGNDGALVKTTNAGQTWTPADVTVDGQKVVNRFNEVHYPMQNVALLAADNGAMLRTDNDGQTWNYVLPYDLAYVDVKRMHPAVNIRENGIGLGGAIYILDSVGTRTGKDDFVKFNRVRFQNNQAYTGAAIYSDNYDLKMILQRSLVANNKAVSEIGMKQNHITGPALDANKDKVIDGNFASSDLAGAILYGEIIGPEPFEVGSWAANSMYDNQARFLIRLPDAPDTKGALAGRRPGPGGIDTLRANYWGRTEADVNLFIHNLKDLNYLPRDFERMETFFIEQADKTYLSYKFGAEGTDTLNQGPFERNGTYTTINSTEEVIKKWEYIPVALRNKSVAEENVADTNTIPEKFLMSFRVYDLYDKGTDIKVADYSNRRLSPIEDFAVGIPPVIITHSDTLHPNLQTYVRRFTHDPKIVEMADPATGKLKYPMIANLQSEWKPDLRYRNDNTKGYYHPIGYPLFLETEVNYDGEANIANKDIRSLNETVFFVINETTGDFIRTNMKQVSETDGRTYNKFRSRVEMIPDMTKRNQQTTVRRSAEKLLNLGVGDMLLYSLRSNPVNEDKATLRGRKYYGPHTQMGGKLSSGNVGINDLYLNRDHWAPSNNNTATYWAGEKYQALPVDTGDVVRVISRTALWKYGAVRAFNEGIAFRITGSTMPPVFTGDIVKLATDTLIKIQRNDVDPNKLDTIKVTDFLNKIWVTEDRSYPVSKGTYSGKTGFDKGRDSILTVTAIDYNNFYDPRSMYDSTAAYYAQLSYSLETEANSGVSNWLRYNIIPSSNGYRDGAKGYMVLKGTPMNPYVIPGGEEVTLKARNFAPSKQTIDLLGQIWGKDTLDKFMYIFPPYFHAPDYDLGENVRRARYLQQDTINNASTAEARTKFRLFVADSTPRFIAYSDSPVVSYKDLNYQPVKGVAPKYQDSNAVRVMVLPSIYRNGFCTMTEDKKLIASVTDKLRFQVDFNTDDEAEDFWAAKDGWDFKYGKTSYGFYNIAIRNNPNDTAIIDIRNQTRPAWMKDQYIYKYNKEDNADRDNFLSDYTSNGRLNVRIDTAEAFNLLKIANGANNGMNLDTMFTVVANDGHSGLTTMPIEVYVNVKPTIKAFNADRLPDAKEDMDYNPNLLDSNKMVKVYDPNMDQFHRYELIYPGDLRTRVPKDPCFSEAGYWDLSDKKTTPTWLKINPNSGLLYGMPTIKDNIRDGIDETVTVMVWDRIKQFGTKSNLSAVKNNGTSLFAVGEKGTIIKVDKTGGSWEFVKVAGIEAFDLKDITFADNGQIGFIVGSNGLILKTTDGGNTWNINNTTYRVYNLNTVDFKDENTLMAAGTQGSLLVTKDAGATWTEVKKSNAAYTSNNLINKVKYLGNDKYFVGGNSFIKVVSADGATIEDATGITGEVKDVYKIENNKFIAITGTEIYKSDNGNAWTKATAPSGQFISIGYYEINNDNGFNSTKSKIIYITGSNGRMYYSKDGGNKFYVANANVTNDVFRVKFNNTAEGIVKNINDLVMIDENNGFIVGNEGMIAKINKAQNITTYKDNTGTEINDTTVVINPIVITTKDEDMLSDLRQFKLKVVRADHGPVITGTVKTGCYEINETSFSDTLYVMDSDLLRPESDEYVVLTVDDPAHASKWQIVKDTIKSADAWTTDANGNKVAKKKIAFVIKYNGNAKELGTGNRFTVTVKATDKSGNVKIYKAEYRYTLTPDFVSQITVANNNGDSQILEWGTAPNTKEEPVTTGDNNEKPEASPYGTLDENYCEYEIAPTPDKKIFDARWIIPTRTGTLRNIFPRAIAGQACQMVYKNTFQTGGNVDAVGTGNYVPLKISWDKSKVPAKGDQTLNPAGSSWWLVDATSGGRYFSINMSTGLGTYIGDCQLNVNGNTVILTLMQVAVEGFNIIYDCTSSVDGEVPATSGIRNVAPSIVSSNATVNFGLTEYGHVKIEVYDAIGNYVKTITDREYIPGNNLKTEFDGRDASGNLLPNGTYTIRMTSGTNVSTYQIKVIR